MSQLDLDTLAKALANAAMTVLVRSCRKEVAGASHTRLESACAAMRAKARPNCSTTPVPRPGWPKRPSPPQPWNWRNQASPR